MDSKKTHEFRKVYADIINGYSIVESSKEKIYVRHLSETDIGLISSKYKIHYEEAQSKGLLTTKQKIKLLKDQEIWSEQEDKEMKRLSSELERNVLTKKNLIIKSQIEEVSNLIKEQEKELKILEGNQSEMVDLTCEKYADRKSNEEIINICLFKNNQLKENIFTRKEYEEMDQSRLYAYIYIYNEALSSFTSKFIKQLATLPFFMNSFLICNDDPMIFFGKPIVELTNFQIDLFSTGKYYKSIMSSAGSPPESEYEDPEKLVEWYDGAEAKQLAKKSLEGKEGSTIVGADREQIQEAIDNDPLAVDLGKEIKKVTEEKGKKVLNMADVMKIHGHNAKF